LTTNRVGLSAERAISAPTSGNQPAVAQPILASMPPQTIAQAAHAEFQRTMQQFLDLQVTIGALRGGALAPAPAPVIPSPPQLRLQPEVNPRSNGSPAVMPSRPAAAPVPVANSTTPPVAPVVPAPAKPPVPATASPRQYPFVESLLEHTGDRVVFECELTPEKHPFLRHHTFFGSRVSDRHPELTPLPIMPLAMSMELLAEAAALLVPQSSVVAISNIVASRWLPFPGQSRRVRAVARLVNDQTVDARLLEADGDAEHEIVAAMVELGELPEALGIPQLARPSAGPPPWKPAAVYNQILYHGPAFQGIEEIESWGANAIAARVQEPKTPLLSSSARGALVLPVALVDTASQIPGLTNGDLESAGATCIMAFPNTIGRLVFARGVFAGEPLAAVSHFEMVPGKLNSDTEFVDGRGQAVLRYLSRVEETVPFPLPLYRYAMNPHTAFQPRTLNELFADVPGADRLSICEATAAGERLWIKGIWARMLAYQILGPDERAVFNRLKLPPVALADWLLGRLAAKEAARVRLQHGGCHADTEIRNDAEGRPEAWIDDTRAADISLSHKTFEAVAVAAVPGEFRGLGIDCEPLDSLPAEVLADAFTDAERELLGSAGDAAAWLRAGWGAKEAAGKALGCGVLGGPRNLVIESIDREARSLSLSLRGQMAETFSEFTTGGTPITAHWRQLRNQIIVLCILPTEKIS
jgi:4'-phosphopantetheinyl transferase EntD